MTKFVHKAIMRPSGLKSKYHKNRTIEFKAKYKKQNNFCSELEERIKILLNLRE